MSTNMSWQERSKPGLPMYKRRFSSISASDMANKTLEELEEQDKNNASLAGSTVSPFLNNKLQKFLPPELFSAACDLHGLSYLMDVNSRQPSRITSLLREYFEDTFA